MAIGANQANSEKPDDTVPTLKRQAELHEDYRKNIAAGYPPYADVRLKTRGELTWIMQERGWWGERNEEEDIGDFSDEPSREPLERANFSRVDASDANLANVALYKANLEGADFTRANLSGACLSKSALSHAQMAQANLLGADLTESNAHDLSCIEANMAHAALYNANLTGAMIIDVDLSHASLCNVNLTGAFVGADLSGVDLRGAILKGTKLWSSQMNVRTVIDSVTMDNTTCLADVIWNDAPIMRVAWSDFPVLGDETIALRPVDEDSEPKSAADRLDDYETAFRAYRQLAVVLHDQGMSEIADHYGYRAQLMQREIHHYRGKYGWWFFWFFLDWLAGYGYKPERTLVWYGSALTVSTLAYFILALTHTPDMTLWTHQMWVALFESFIASLTSLHGRGLFPGHTESHWQWLIAGADAVVGLVIEASFVATFVQRFFAR